MIVERDGGRSMLRWHDRQQRSSGDRETCSTSLSVGAGGLRSLLDRFANPDVGTAATEVACHGIIDVRIGGIRLARQQSGSGDDLAWLAVAALHHLQVEPSFLNLLAVRCITDGFDCSDCRGADTVDGGNAGASGDTIDKYGTRATQRLAAAELGASHAEHVTQHPEQGGVAVNIYGVIRLIDSNRVSHVDLRLVAPSDHP